MNLLTIVKIGGKVTDNKAALYHFLDEFASLPGLKLLVHGGGKQVTETGAQLGVRSTFVRGRRITDERTLEVIMMVCGGLINKTITAYLQSKGCNAIGISAADGNVITAKKRPVIDVDFGLVGDIVSEGVNCDVLNLLLNSGLVPVIAPLTHDGCGNLLNTNADTIAQEVARSLSSQYEVRIIYCFEHRGVMANPKDSASVITNLTQDDFHNLSKAGVISGGMIPKLENAFQAVTCGVRSAVIGHASELSDLTRGKAGTTIQLR